MPTTKTNEIKAERDLTFANLSEDERLRRDIYRSDKEKFLLRDTHHSRPQQAILNLVSCLQDRHHHAFCMVGGFYF